MANPLADIELFRGTRAHWAKEVGPARVAQQWKEGLRQIVPDPWAWNGSLEPLLLPSPRLRTHPPQKIAQPLTKGRSAIASG